MSDTQPGPDWWMASDGKWYAPEQHPDRRAEAVAAAGTDYPARFDFDPGDGQIARWRAIPFLHLFMAIPHLIILWVLGYVRAVLALISFFSVLFVKRIPQGIFGVQTMILRYSNRVMTFLLLMREQYPEFEFQTSTEDPGGDPARTSVDRPDEMNRWLPLVKWLLAIPHLIALAVLYMAAFVVSVVGWFTVLFTGRYPAGPRDFLVNVGKWGTRVYAYVLLLRDEYPPFSLS